MAVPTEFITRIIVRLVAAGLVLGLPVVMLAVWLGVRDSGDFAGGRRDRLHALSAERAKVQASLGEVHGRMAKITTDLATEQERIRQTAGIIAQLKGLDSSWDKLTGGAQQQANTERREKLEKQQAESIARVAALQTEYTRTGWERDGLEIELAKAEAQLKSLEANQSKAGHYLLRAWNHPVGWLKVKAWVLLVLGLYVLGPFIVRHAKDREEARRL